ncbi:MAG: CinA family protein [Clostridia bacterium]|nr:CinA family protein [Clostridia bacterium]
MKSIEALLVELLVKEKMKLATAESCTGGLIAQKITSVPGASECFDCGVVTYSNEQKSKLLGVSEKTLEKYGAVSMQTALEMCKGVKELANADFGISVTGIAGPGGGTEEKPVGTVWIGICGKNIHRAERFLFDGDRNQVRESTANTALNMVMEIINGIS